MKLYSNLIDLGKEVIRRAQKRIPLGAFNVDLYDDVFAAVTVLGHLALHRVALLLVRDKRSIGDAFFMEEGVTFRTLGSFQVETVVLVNGDADFGRKIATPFVVATDAV